jgi:hypothetical protein
LTPKIYVAIPTGSVKEYALLYMMAALRNIYYPHDSIQIHFSITDRKDQASATYIQHVKGIVANSKMPMDFTIHYTTITPQEAERWGPYSAVIKNLHELRKDFLDGDADYFWVLGGDNLPGTGTLKRLLDLNVDVASALIRQRPLRGREFDVDGDKDAKSIRPCFWEYVWQPNDVRNRKDLEPKLKHSLLRSWVEMPPMRLALIKDNTVFHTCNFGSGCSLVKRKVLESIGYYLGNGYHSEDIHFGQCANFLGFTTALNPAVICAHFDPDGRLY